MRELGPVVRSVALLVLLGLAGFCAYAAFQVFGWERYAAREDKRLGAVHRSAGIWAAADPVALAVLGVREDVRLRRAAARFRRARVEDPTEIGSADQLIASADATFALAAAGRRAGLRGRAFALNLEAVLAGEAAELELDSSDRFERAIELLRQAIRLDPTNEAAKANLERLLSGSVDSVDPRRGNGFGRFGDGAGSSPGGSGY